MNPAAALGAALATTGIYAGANLAASLARNKTLAVLLGPGGFGEWSQVMSFFYLLQTGAVLGVTTGVARYVAEYRRTGRNVADVIASAGALVLGAAVLMAAASAAFSPRAAVWIVAKPAWAGVFALTALAIPFVAAQSLFQAALQGYEDRRGLALTSVGTAAAGLTAALAAGALWGARGVAAYIVTSFAAGSYLYARRLRRHVPSLRGARVERALIGGVLSYGGVALAGTVAAAGATLAGRSLVLRAYGPEAAGYYQAMSGLTLQILPLFLSGIALYTVPRLAGLRDGAQAGPVIAPSVRLMAPLVAAGLSLGLVFREPFFALLFSPAFAPAAAWFPVQLTGDVLLALAWSAGAHLLPMGRLRIFLACEALRAAVFLAAAAGALALRLEPTGAAPLAVAHAISYAAEAAVFLYFARRGFGLPLREPAARLAITFGAWGAMIAVSYLAPLPWRFAAWTVCAPIMLACAVTAGDVRAVRARLAAWAAKRAENAA